MRNQSKAITVIVLVLAIGASLSAPPTLYAQATSTNQSTIRHVVTDSRPLVDQLLPGDKIVEFARGYAEVNVATPDRPLSRQQTLAMAVSDAEQVILVEVETADARLIDQGRWIATRLACKVVEVMKSPHSLQLQPGANIAFEVVGGETQIDGVIVRIRSQVEYKVGLRYLAFLKSMEGSGEELTARVYGPQPRLVERQRLMAVPGHDNDKLAGLTLTDVRRAAAKRR